MTLSGCHMDDRKTAMLAAALRASVSLEKLVLNRNPLGAENVAVLADAILGGMLMLRDVVPGEIAAQAARAEKSTAPATHARLERMRTWKGLRTLCLCNCDVAQGVTTFRGALAGSGPREVMMSRGLDALGALIAHPACTLKRLNLSKNKLSGECARLSCVARGIVLSPSCDCARSVV